MNQALAEYKPGLEGVIAGITSISEVSPNTDTLVYRGYDLHDLVKYSNYEEVAHLLIYKELPTKKQLDQFKKNLLAERMLSDEIIDIMKKMPKESHPMHKLKSVVSLLALYDPDAIDNSAEANIKKATNLIAKIPTIITYTHQIETGQELIPPDNTLSHAANFLYMLNGKKPTALEEKIIDTSFILYAEHGLNASTFCAIVTISTLSDFYSGVTSAIGTLFGPLHGGANEKAMEMLLEIGTEANAEKWITEALAKKKKIMGFGHRVYKNGDCRAPILKNLAKQLVELKKEPKWIKIADIVENKMVKEKNIYPNVDFPASYAFYMLGLPIPLYTPMFAASRVAGWAAHMMEQLENNKLIRPEAVYDGKRGLKYVPIESR